MDNSSSSRRMRRFLPMVAVLAAVGCVGVATATAATPAPPSSSARTKINACLKAKGLTVPPTQADLANTTYRTALRTCVQQSGGSLAGRGGLGGGSANPNMQKYVACMKKHGVTISATKKPNRTSAAFKKANTACASTLKAKS
ncbi:MAG: hypothetical protein QOI27_2918 [Gaiellaceae bacterium]|jgi:hypothetical protein|nr:hypothetical protein [Gaiellaceae bacterium]MDX6469867.1 hypothetical protein [Gaiellaceae bacterium]